MSRPLAIVAISSVLAGHSLADPLRAVSTRIVNGVEIRLGKPKVELDRGWEMDVQRFPVQARGKWVTLEHEFVTASFEEGGARAADRFLSETVNAIESELRMVLPNQPAQVRIRAASKGDQLVMSVGDGPEVVLGANPIGRRNRPIRFSGADQPEHKSIQDAIVRLLRNRASDLPYLYDYEVLTNQILDARDALSGRLESIAPSDAEVVRGLIKILEDAAPTQRARGNDLTWLQRARTMGRGDMLLTGSALHKRWIANLEVWNRFGKALREWSSELPFDVEAILRPARSSAALTLADASATLLSADSGGYEELLKALNSELARAGAGASLLVLNQDGHATFLELDSRTLVAPNAGLPGRQEIGITLSRRRPDGSIVGTYRHAVKRTSTRLLSPESLGGAALDEWVEFLAAEIPGALDNWPASALGGCAPIRQILQAIVRP